MSKRWYKEHKREHYYRRAKKEGYRSRAVYKLMNINDKFGLIRPGDRVLDLGAAPGGWSQAGLTLVGDRGKVVGVDLDHIAPLEGVVFIKGDMRDEQTVKEVLKEMGEADVVISDMSPNISGVYSVDQARSFELAMCAVDFSKRVLRPGGNMLTKVFEGEDFPTFLREIKGYFRLIKPFSPRASRSKSSEIYVVCKNAHWDR